MDRQTERVKTSEVCQLKTKNCPRNNFFKKESTSQAAIGRTERAGCEERGLSMQQKKYRQTEQHSLLQPQRRVLFYTHIPIRIYYIKTNAPSRSTTKM